MARPFPPGATTPQTVPLLPMPVEESIAIWPLLKLTPAQRRQVANGQNGWLLTHALGVSSASEVIEADTATGLVTAPVTAPRVAGPQVAQGQAAAPAPTANLGQAARQAATGQLVGAAVRARQQAAGGGQAIRFSGPMSDGRVAPVQTPQAAVGPPTRRLRRGRLTAQWTAAFGLVACLVAFTPLMSHLLVIMPVVAGLIALMLGAIALRQVQRGAAEQRMARLGVALGVVGLLASIALTIVSIHVLHH